MSGKIMAEKENKPKKEQIKAALDKIIGGYGKHTEITVTVLVGGGSVRLPIPVDDEYVLHCEVRLVKVPKSLRDIANFRKNCEK